LRSVDVPLLFISGHDLDGSTRWTRDLNHA
jgi:hypothetical protein